MVAEARPGLQGFGVKEIGGADHTLSAYFLNYSHWSSSFLFLYFLSLSAPPSPMRTGTYHGPAPNRDALLVPL